MILKGKKRPHCFNKILYDFDYKYQWSYYSVYRKYINDFVYVIVKAVSHLDLSCCL